MILARVADRRHDAMEECLSVYGGLVWSLALKMTAMREDAEEAVQEIFIDVWKYAGRFDPARSSEGHRDDCPAAAGRQAPPSGLAAPMLEPRGKR